MPYGLRDVREPPLWAPNPVGGWPWKAHRNGRYVRKPECGAEGAHLTALILTEMNALSGAFPDVEVVAGMPATWKGPGGAGRYRPLSG